MTEPFRIRPASDAKPVRFTFDGHEFSGVEGDTLASALLANGVHLTGRSYKYHRPRGILSAGPEEPNALMGIARDKARSAPNVRAPVQEIFEGMAATSQNRFPSLAFDVGVVNDWLSPFFSAGFYYKTFMWPPAAWKHIYEPIVRYAAGLGVAPKEPDPDHYAARFAHCDVLVVGMGPTGLSAALAAAEAGASVIVCDERAGVGGSLQSESGAVIDGKSGGEWAREAEARLRANANVRVLTRTTAFGYHAQNFVALAERVTDHLDDPDPKQPRERLWQVRAKRVVLAQGAIERILVFDGNDRPGVMLAGAARHYLNRHGVAVGKSVGVYTACDSAYWAALDLSKAGVKVAAIIDLRDAPDVALMAAARSAGIDVLTGHAVLSTAGRLRIKSMTVAPAKGGAKRTIPVDALIMSAGWTPSVHLFSQSRGKVRFDEATGNFLPGIYAQDCACAGGGNGTTTLDAAIAEGWAAGAEAAKLAGFKPGKAKAPSAQSQERCAGGITGAAPGAGPEASVKAFIDYQNDVTAKDIRQAVREGMHSIEHVKRFTTNGMASDQGKISNLHGLRIAADALGKAVPEVGLTTFRQPYTPVTFGTIVGHAKGRLFDPTRRTPIHGWAEERGAAFEDVGNWKRAWYFPRAGETMHQAVNRECRTVREAAGFFDASTLGKIEVVGPDAAKFLDIMYTNPMAKLGVGRTRYGIMCREDGFIYDDGVVARLAEDRFHVTTTTGGAPRIMNMMEDYLQTEFPDLKVWLTSITEQYAVIAIQGPKARAIVSPFVEGVDLDPSALPHMSVRECRVAGVPARLFTMSFTGEIGYEINVPADHGRAVWELLWAEGEKHGACAYGTEAMHVLRAEKGYIIVGQDTDGTVTPDDAALAWAVGKNKTDFVGIRGMKRPDLVKGGRKQLVGFLTKDENKVLEEGAQIVADPRLPIPMKMIGHVTSSYWSENCGRSIAMALIEDGRARMGETLYVPMPEGVIEAVVTKPVFFDEKGERLNG
jgi:sarcosine oxidase subunit alpha